MSLSKASSKQVQEGAAPPQIKILEVEKAHFNILTKLTYYKLTKLSAVAEEISRKRDTHDTVSASLSSLCPYVPEEILNMLIEKNLLTG